jgi:RecB family endonuclease NucS
MAIKIDATEKDIEDVLCEHMPELLGLRFVGRQIQTPAGIVDILARAPSGHFYIIELKKGQIYEEAQASNFALFIKLKNKKNNEEGVDG